MLLEIGLPLLSPWPSTQRNQLEMEATADTPWL